MRPSLMRVPDGQTAATPQRATNFMHMEKLMLTLDLPAEPYWLALPRGERVEMRHVTSAVTATRMMTVVRKNQQAAAAYG